MRKISAVGLFCCDKFEETPKQKVINMSKLNKFHFSNLKTKLTDHFSVKTRIGIKICRLCNCQIKVKFI